MNFLPKKVIFQIFILGVLVFSSNIKLNAQSKSKLSENKDFQKMIEPFAETEDDSIMFDGVTYPNINKFVACDRTPGIFVDEISKFIFYTEDVHSKGISGKVIAKVLVTPEGKIIKAFVEYSENELLNPLTLEAIFNYNAKTKITPAVQRGKNISLWISIPFTFSLNKTKIQYDNLPDPDDFMVVEREPGVDINAVAQNVIYPEDARKEGIQGRVIIKVLVLKTGELQKPFVEYSDNTKLDQSALDAVISLNRIEPAILKGEPVDCWISIPINFRLRD